MFCTNCGKELPEGLKVCSNCGFKLDITEDTTFNSDSINKKNHSESCNSSTYNPDKNSLSTRYSKPLTTANFFLIQVLFLIPILNIFFIIYWSLKNDINDNLKAYARSMLIWLIIAAIFSIFALLTLTFMRYPLSFSFRFSN